MLIASSDTRTLTASHLFAASDSRTSFRLKYPHLIDAAVASSAPLLALINFTDYLAVVRTSLGPGCSQSIAQSTEQITKLLHDSHDGWKALTKSFMLCDPLDGTSEEDVGNFVQSLASNFEGVVQYNKDNRDFEVRNILRIVIASSRFLGNTRRRHSFRTQFCSPPSFPFAAIDLPCTNRRRRRRTLR